MTNMMPIHNDLTAGSNGSAAAVQAASTCYLEAPALSDVLTEQMSYLLDHAGHNTPECPDCVRLAEVVRLLMKPFE